MANKLQRLSHGQGKGPGDRVGLFPAGGIMMLATRDSH